jgi:hypothetical protein
LTVTNRRPDTIAVVWDSARFVGIDSAVRPLVDRHVPATAILPGAVFRTFVRPGAHRFDNYPAPSPDSTRADKCISEATGAYLLPAPYNNSPGPVNEAATRVVGRTFEFVIAVQVGQTLHYYFLVYRVDSYRVNQRQPG